MAEARGPSDGWIGTLLENRYRVNAELGRGGMGTVFLATDEKVDRLVVVKVPDVSLLEQPGFRERFARETRSLIQLSHPHIVKVLDVGEAGDVPYLVLEHLGGGSLKERIEESPGGRLIPAQVLDWLPNAARTLDVIHKLGVIHRDVKPANILFDEHGNVFLADFGIAKALGEQDTGLTQTGSTPGTPDYMAPESVLDVGLDGRADQYALATIVYKALSGRLPISATSPLAALFKKQKEDPIPLSQLVDGVDEKLGGVVMKALSRERDDRFPDCAAFAKSYFKALGESSTPLTLVDRSTVAPSRPPATLPGTIDVGTPGGVASPPSVAGAPEDEPEMAIPLEPIAESRRRLPVGLILGVTAAVATVVVVGLVLLLGNRGGPSGGNGETVPEGPAPLVRLTPAVTTIYTRQPVVTVRGRVENAPKGRIRMGRREVDLRSDGSFAETLGLAEAESTFEICGVTAGGRRGETISLRVVLDTEAPELAIEFPPDGHLTREAKVEVRGRVDDPNADAVWFGGVEHELSTFGAFRLEAPLSREGENPIEITARDHAGNEVSRKATVVRDTRPPEITAEVGFEGGRSRLDVTVDEDVAEVLVGGSAAQSVGPRTFRAPLDESAEGRTIEVVARDRAGNTASETVKVESGAEALLQTALRYANGDGVKQDDAQAAEWFLRAAQRGNAEAQYRLGMMLVEGRGVRRDYRSGADWLRQAADQRHPVGMYQYGECFWRGRGVPEDEAKAVAWYRLSAEAGLAIAQHDLGWCYQNGRGIPQDDRLAAVWYRKAADQGLAAAQYGYGFLCAAGRGVPGNLQEAAAWYRRAAAQGQADAMHALGLAYLKGRGVPENEAEATRWFRSAAEREHPAGLYEYGECFWLGRGGVSRDEARAVSLYRKAAEKGHAVAQRDLGWCYENGRGVTRDLAQAAAWYRKAADQGNVSAQNNLAVAYLNGSGVPKDHVEALKWFRRAADQDFATAQTWIGLCYENGYGVGKDMAQAAAWYRKGANGGDAAGQYFLGICYSRGQGVPQSDREAVLWFRKGAAQKHAGSEKWLGWCYENGRGVTRSQEQALHWYGKAAEHGDAYAQYALGEACRTGNGVRRDVRVAMEWYRKSAAQGYEDAKKRLAELEGR
jgi:TPR repeat protein